jgi:DNA polymerase elongation subunit (family B)
MLSVKKLDRVYQKINEGEKIKFIYMKEPNPIRSNIIAFPMSLPKEFDLETYIDYDIQFIKAFLEPIKIITESIDWKTEQVSSLESFFG